MGCFDGVFWVPMGLLARVNMDLSMIYVKRVCQRHFDRDFNWSDLFRGPDRIRPNAIRPVAFENLLTRLGSTRPDPTRLSPRNLDNS